MYIIINNISLVYIVNTCQLIYCFLLMNMNTFIIIICINYILHC